MLVVDENSYMWYLWTSFQALLSWRAVYTIQKLTLIGQDDVELICEEKGGDEDKFFQTESLSGKVKRNRISSMLEYWRVFFQVKKKRND